MKRFLFLFFALFFVTTGAIYAQNGEIQGKVTDATTGETIPFATVQTTVNGSLQAVQTDFDGYYSLKPIPAGAYDLKVSYVGYANAQTNGVIVNADKITYLDVKLSSDTQLLGEVVISSYKVPLIDAGSTSTGSTVTKEEIVNLPTRSVNSIAANTAGVYQKDEGGGVNVKGSRSDATDVYIDGIKVRGGTNIPQASIEQLTVVTGGVPARYGDATGGIINITTRGPSSKFAGGVEVATSKFLDDYGYYLGSFNLSGPIAKVKKGTDKERTLMGFFLSGEYNHEDDDDPSYVGIWKAKDDVLANVLSDPLSDSGIDATRLVGMDQLENVPNRPNMAKNSYSGAGKIDIQPVQGLNFTIGGTYSYQTGGISRALYTREYHRRFEMFNWEHTPKYEFTDYRGYFRITQRLGAQKDMNATDDDKNKKASVLQNAYYTLQFDYSRAQEKSYDPVFKDDPFAYGYIGQFNTTRFEPTYVFTQGEITNPKTPLTGTYLSAYSPRDIVFTDNGGNSSVAAYANDYFGLGNTVNSYDALIYKNGQLASSSQAPYSLYYSPGRPHDVIFNRNNDQYRLTFMGSFDLKKSGGSERNKHAIEFGFEYEQRIDRYYNLNPSNLWVLMNNQIGKFGDGISFDTANPLLVIDGQQYTWEQYQAIQQQPNPTVVFDVSDTVTYNLIVTQQSHFDKKFREKFGYSNTQFVDPWSKAPSDYTLDMFSASELLVTGGNSSLVDYAGYDYLGNPLSSQPAFEDFWTAKDDEGNFTRPQAAFRPVYMAGFIQDKFSFKDLLFNVGVRVDRFDANQKTPKDKYSPLFAVKTASEVSNLGAHPTNIGDDYVVYVNDPDNPSKILGYRNGDQWYNATGTTIDNPGVIQQSGSFYPYLVEGQAKDSGAENYNPTLAFQDYKPQINVMPRIAFSFELSEEALFFAHYDILTQRPQGRMTTLASDYYYFEAATQNIINNPNLKPERTIDYQIGFRQKLGQTSAISISGFYREMKDMLQVISIKNALTNRTAPPTSYNTYGNVDFGTVKGLELSYDLRRTKNVRMVFTYTLQYADGTGSGDRSQETLVNNNKPNLRTIFPLSYDSRHLINVSFDYRYDEGAEYNGPKLFGKDILANTGLNLILRARSGEPYSRQENAIPDAKFGVQNRNDLEGTFNGSRLPFNFRADLRIDKDFKLNFGKKEGKADRYISVYFLVQNLLNSRNVTGVYGYTGRPDDDGYLTSPAGLSSIEVTNTTDNSGFIDQYTTKVIDPENFSLPRRTRLGLIFNF